MHLRIIGTVTVELAGFGQRPAMLSGSV
jgi:hypothetical protein